MLKRRFTKSIAVILAVLTALSLLAFAPVTADAAASVYTARTKTIYVYGSSQTYSMPQIYNMNTADVNDINADIRSKCNPVINDAIEAEQKGYSMVPYYMSYSAYTKNNVLSVVIDLKYENSYHIYYIYNINATTGKKMNNDQVAKAFGTTWSNAKNVAKWKIKDEFYNISAATKKVVNWKSQRSRSITDSNLNNTMLAAGPNGLYGYYVIYWIAGAERYVHTALVYNTSNPTINAHATNNGAQVTWGKVSDVRKYRVYKKVNGSWKKLGDSEGTSFVDKSAKAGNTYYYTVRGIAADGSAFMSGYNSSGKKLPFLKTPQISKIETSSGGLKLTWNKLAGAGKYRVYFKKNGSWTNIGDTTGNTAELYCYGSGGTFTYTIRALSADGKQFLSGYNTSGKGKKYVYDPEITSISNTSKGVALKWSKYTGTEKFRLYRKTSGSSWQKLTDTTATSYTDGSAKNGTRYYYTVRCISSNAKTFQSHYNADGWSIVCKR